jgi:hypothetical protein
VDLRTAHADAKHPAPKEVKREAIDIAKLSFKTYDNFGHFNSGSHTVIAPRTARDNIARCAKTKENQPEHRQLYDEGPNRDFLPMRGFEARRRVDEGADKITRSFKQMSASL